MNLQTKVTAAQKNSEMIKTVKSVNKQIETTLIEDDADLNYLLASGKSFKQYDRYFFSNVSCINQDVYFLCEQYSSRQFKQLYTHYLIHIPLKNNLTARFILLFNMNIYNKKL